MPHQIGRQEVHVKCQYHGILDAMKYNKAQDKQDLTKTHHNKCKRETDLFRGVALFESKGRI